MDSTFGHPLVMTLSNQGKGVICLLLSLPLAHPIKEPTEMVAQEGPSIVIASDGHGERGEEDGGKRKSTPSSRALQSSFHRLVPPAADMLGSRDAEWHLIQRSLSFSPTSAQIMMGEAAAQWECAYAWVKTWSA